MFPRAQTNKGEILHLSNPTADFTLIVGRDIFSFSQVITDLSKPFLFEQLDIKYLQAISKTYKERVVLFKQYLQKAPTLKEKDKTGQVEFFYKLGTAYETIMDFLIDQIDSQQSPQAISEIAKILKKITYENVDNLPKTVKAALVTKS